MEAEGEVGMALGPERGERARGSMPRGKAARTKAFRSARSTALCAFVSRTQPTLGWRRWHDLWDFFYAEWFQMSLLQRAGDCLTQSCKSVDLVKDNSLSVLIANTLPLITYLIGCRCVAAS